MAKKNPDTGTFTNAADDKALEDVRRIEAAGGDPFGDDDDSSAPAADAEALDKQPVSVVADDDSDKDNEDDDAADLTAKAGDPAAAPDQAVAEAEAQPDEPPSVRFNTPTRDELATKRGALLEAKDKAFTDFDEGTITREDYLKQSRGFDEQLMSLAANAALLEATEQALVTAQQTKLDAIRDAAKKSGLIDYDDAAAAAEYNAALQFVSGIAANAKLNFGAMADKAHVMVLAQRGITAPSAEGAKPQIAPTLRKPPVAPITLAGLPSASTPNSNGGVDEQLSRLHGQDFEAAISAMPKGKRDAWMDS